MNYIVGYNDYANEGFKNNLIVAAISMSLLNSCSILHKHKHKEPIETVEDIIKNRNLHLNKKFEENMGKLPLPVDGGKITSKFGVHTVPNTKVKVDNKGITINTTKNSILYPVFNGVVTRIFDVCGELTIIVNHGKYYTVYSGIKKLRHNIKVNSEVSYNESIGFASNSLHFEIWKANGNKAKPINPELCCNFVN